MSNTLKSKPKALRQSNFELLKIVAMLMIISHHLVSKNAFNVDTDISGITANKLLFQILGNNAFIGNNLFFLTSAWFLSERPVESATLSYSKRSWIRIEKECLFYSIILFIVSYLRGGGAIHFWQNQFFQSHLTCGGIRQHMLYFS